MIDLSAFNAEEQMIFEIYHDLNINRPYMLLHFDEIQKHWVHRGKLQEKLAPILDVLITQGYLQLKDKDSFLLTDKLFQEKIFRIPSEAELQKAVVDIFRELKCRVGDSLMFADFRIKWIDRGFQPNELKDTLEKMINSNYLEFNNTGTITLTQNGFNTF